MTITTSRGKGESKAEMKIKREANENDKLGERREQVKVGCGGRGPVG